MSDGIVLSSGEKLDADIIVTATGLNMRFLGGIDLSVNGAKVDPKNEFLWHFAMLSNVPNLGQIIGYWNASWTLGSDNASRLFTRVIKHMDANGYTSATRRRRAHCLPVRFRVRISRVRWAVCPSVQARDRGRRGIITLWIRGRRSGPT